VQALADPQRNAETRNLLRRRFGAGSARDLEALLASAPLEGVDPARRRDGGRNVDL
jgi:hypothetical protein